MAKQQLKINIELKDIDLVKNLIEMLQVHFDELPKILQSQLKQISETGINDYTPKDFHNDYPDFDMSKLECSEIKFLSANKILKKIKVGLINGIIETCYPEHFYLKYDGKTIIEWQEFKMSNIGRVNLVTRFKCATCGNQLELSREVNKETKDQFPNELSDGITGADKVEMNVFIEPCKVCIGKPTRQLQTLKEILRG